MRKGGFWCESCSAEQLGQLPEALDHLRKKHNLDVIRCGCWQQFDITQISPPRSIATCLVCNQKFDYPDNIHSDYTSLYHRHLKAHRKFVLDKKSFRTITSLLHYVDLTYNVHICYEFGMTKKKLFLDGIAKEQDPIE